MGGVTAADIATYYGINLVRGVILMGSFPHRNMLNDVATPFILNFIPSAPGPIPRCFWTYRQSVRRVLRGQR
jgi:hypothetical protein